MTTPFTKLPATLAAMAAAACLASPASAATWVDLGQAEGLSAHIDADSLRLSGGKAKAWVRWTWAQPQDLPGWPGRSYRSEKQLHVIDCEQGTLAEAQGVRYAGPDGQEEVDSYVLPEAERTPTDVIPETLGESVFHYACSARRHAAPPTAGGAAVSVATLRPANSRGVGPATPRAEAQLCIRRRLLAIDIRMPRPRPSETMAVPP